MFYRHEMKSYCIYFNTIANKTSFSSVEFVPFYNWNVLSFHFCCLLYHSQAIWYQSQTKHSLYELWMQFFDSSKHFLYKSVVLDRWIREIQVFWISVVITEYFVQFFSLFLNFFNFFGFSGIWSVWKGFFRSLIIWP